MATFVSIDDIHTNIKVNYGLCPGDPATIIVDNFLGGGGNPNNYYYNWFQKDPNPNNCNNYVTTARDPNGVNRAITVSFITYNDYLSVNIPFLGLSFTYGVPTAHPIINNDIINALIGFGRQFVIDSFGTLIIYYRDDDPLLGILGCAGLQIYHYIKNPNIPGSFVTNPLCLSPSQPLERKICGWIPIAGGLNVDTFVVPSNVGTYMVEVVDEVGTPDYGIIELNEVIPTCAFDIMHVTCNGKNNGAITVLPFYDESSGITFSWTKDGDPFSNQKDLINLAPGTYCLTLVNSFNCQRTCCVTIFEPLPLVATIELQKNPSCIDCRNSDRYGEILISVTGGNTDCAEDCLSPYEYQLNNGEWKRADVDNKIFINKLLQGHYRLQIKDCKCCYTFVEFDIVEQKINIEV